jgi:hypothetical protein
MSNKGIRNRSWKSRYPSFVPKHTNRQYYKEEGKVICVRHDTSFGDFYLNFFHRPNLFYLKTQNFASNYDLFQALSKSLTAANLNAILKWKQFVTMAGSAGHGAISAGSSEARPAM